MKNLQEQVGKTAQWAKNNWKLLLLAIEVVILLFGAVSYWRQIGSLAYYEFGEEELWQYDGEAYGSCFGGSIDETRPSGLYDIIPEQEMYLKKGYYRYTVNYESTSEGSFCWPHTYVEFYNVIEEAVTYLQDGAHGNTAHFWLNADLNVALRFFYSGTGTAKVTGFVLEETPVAANMRLFSVVMLLFGVNIAVGLSAYARKHGIKARSKYVFAGLVTLSLFASYPLLLESAPNGNDLSFHLARIEGIKDGLLAGQFPVRINPAFYNGYGYANPIFYGEALLYIPAFLRLVGFRLTTCYNLFGILVNLLTSFGSYYCFRKMFREPAVAFASTLLYVMAPYRLVDIYLRAAVGEFTAFLFLPFVAYGLYRIFTEDTRQEQYKWCFWPLLLGLSGIIQSHVITGEMTGGLILAACVVLPALTFQKKRLWALVKTVLYTLALNAWFLVPLADFTLTESVRITQGAEVKMIQDTGLFIPQIMGLFPGYSLIARDAGDGMASEMPLYLGAALVLGMVLCATMLCVAKEEERKKKKQAFFFLSFSILTAWMCTVYFPWDRISTMLPGIPWIASLVSTLQFAWRFLALSSVLAAITAGFGLLFLYRREGRGAFAAAAVVLCLLTGISGMYLMYQCVFSGGSIVKPDLQGENTAVAAMNAEYELVQADYGIMTEIFLPRAYGEVQVNGYEKNGTSISLHVENGGTDGYILLPLQAYKGYHVTSEGGVVADGNLSRGEGAAVRVDIPAGYSGQVQVEYAGFWYWRGAEAITLATALYLGWTAFKKKKCRIVRLSEGC